ncbi:hypothetical protein FBU30_002577 [Linnemannia zychae]|nr:hypothetical protein FBU30_002577 [Linnemannia zychae]
MQGPGDTIEVPGAFKDDEFIFHKPKHSESATHSAPEAKAKRLANVTNPHRESYEVAGPISGGLPMHDSKPRASGNHPTHSLANKVEDTAAGAAATAAAAGASIIAAAKNLIKNRNNTDDPTAHNTHPHSTINTQPLPSPPLSSPKPKGPNDRAPARIAIHAQKPSDKATYGNLDSPGAQVTPGPLSDRALMETPPPASLPPPKTIADPFGPVTVPNWNDGKRQCDEPSPTSENFESPQLGPMRDRPEKWTTASSSASKNVHSPSPLREIPTGNKTEYFPQVPYSESTEKPPTERIEDHNEEDLEREHKPTVELPIVVNTSTIATSSSAPDIAKKVEVVPVENLKDVNITKVAERAQHIPVEDFNTVTSPHPKTPLKERIKEVFHHEHTDKSAATNEPLKKGVEKHLEREKESTVELPVVVNTSTIATSSSAPETTKKVEIVPVENLKYVDLTKAAERAQRLPAVDFDNKSNKPKEPLHERVEEGLEREQEDVENNETAAETTGLRPRRASIIDKVKDIFHPHESTATTKTAPIVTKFMTFKPTDTSLPQNQKVIPDPVFDKRYMVAPDTNVSTRRVVEPIVAPVVKAPNTTTAAATEAANALQFTNPTTLKPLTGASNFPIPPLKDNRSLMGKIKDAFETHSPSEYGPADPEDIQLIDPATIATTRKVLKPSVAPVVKTAAATAATTMAANALRFTNPTTLKPLTGANTFPIPPLKDNRSLMGKIKDAFETHSPSEYGPADPEDIQLTDPLTMMLLPKLPKAEPVVAKESMTTAATPVPMVEKAALKFTDPTTLRPLTGQRNYPIPPQTDSRSLIGKVKDAISFHSSSEYGPAAADEVLWTDPYTFAVLPRVLGEGKKEAKIEQEEVNPEAAQKTSHHHLGLKKTEPISIQDMPHPIIPEKKAATKHTEPTPVQTAPRPVIPPPVVVEKPVEKPTATTTTTTRQTAPAPAVVQPSAPAPFVQQQQQQQLTPTQQAVELRRPSVEEISNANKIAQEIPQSYTGPLPELHPGEEIVWVKTVTTTDYYDPNQSGAPPTNVPVDVATREGDQTLDVPNIAPDNKQKRRSRFFNRLFHRKSHK